jgi:hypothetical protein
LDEDFRGDKVRVCTESSDGQSIEVVSRSIRNSTNGFNAPNARSTYTNNLKLKKDKVEWTKHMTILKEKHFTLPAPKFDPKKSAQTNSSKTQIKDTTICEWPGLKNSPKFSSLGGSSVFANHHDDLLIISPLNINAPENLSPSDDQ